ncbi:MAG TPA: 2OG-Fe(II) oxygenase [Chryseolinea sp.]|nr:2OG-Fe(II) oxygenase [Chryseolinea sp.]HPM29549.1 2OG-Fe(II) oxygenase [Chryseolinea sp.]
MENLKWNDKYDSLNEKGYAILPGLLSKEDCASLMRMYGDSSKYRNIINMQRYRFGKGEYKYFSYPLPSVIQQARENIYQSLVPLANDWMQKLSIDIQYPEHHADFVAQCHSKNQNRPTPLILHYERGGFNTLHQDLYGEVYFPFQVVIVLTQDGVDHTGGELVLTEQMPRAQSKAEVIRPKQGDGIVITTNFRPMKGTRGYYRSNMKHGVSEVKSGRRYALGIIFHDAS